jgi:hypothetical protein
MPTKEKRVGVYVGPELAARLVDDPVRSRSAQVNTLADRYTYLLAGVRLELSDAELSLIRDACNGSVFQPAQIGLPGLVWSVEDAIKLDALDKKWSVDGPALVAKLRGLDRVGLAWLVEDVEKFWSGVSAGCEPARD